VQFDNRHPVRTGFDFARAIAELGVDRGIDAFQRYAFIERNGDANLATPLGTFYVPKKERPLATLVQEVDRKGWLDAFARATSEQKKTLPPPRLMRARKRIEEAIFKLCARGDVEDLRETFVALGAAEVELANGEKFREEKNVRPLAGLSLDWLYKCDDQTSEFKIAAALASVRGEGDVGALRSNIEAFDQTTRQWAKNGKSVVWSAAPLEENLAAVLQRRSIEARMHSLSHPPLTGSRFASLKALTAFINRESDGERFDDDKLEEFLRALILLDWSKDDRPFVPDKQTRYVPPDLPRAYALLKLLFLPKGELQLKPNGQSIIIKHEPSIVPLLRAGRVADALEVAGRRLRASGIAPLASDFFFPPEEGARLAAALLIPIDEPSTRELAWRVLRVETEDQLTDEN
jgi:CRISPR-associated protein Csx17